MPSRSILRPLCLFLAALPMAAHAAPACSDTLLGLSDTLTRGERVTWTGTVRTTSATPPCALPSLPAFPAPATTQFVVNWGQTGSLDTSFHGSVLVHSGSTLLVKPGTYRTGAFTLEWGAYLKVDTTGHSQDTTHPGVQWVVQGAIQWMDGAIFTYPGLSDSLAGTRIAVYVSGTQTVTVGNGGSLRLQLVAPQSSVVLGDQTHVWGRVLARNVYWHNDTWGKFAALRYRAAWDSATTVAISGPRRFWTNATSVPVSWTVNGVAQTTQTTEALPTEGPHWIKRSSGGSSDSVLAMVDRTAPVVQILSPIDGTVTNLTRIAIRWSVDGSVRMDTSSLVEGANSLTRSSDPDSAGNVGSATVHVTRDTHLPVVVIVSPADGLVTNQASQTVQWTVDGVAQTSSQTTLVEGLNTITKTFTSSAGNTGTATIHVTLDTHPPVVQFLSPADGATENTSPITVRWSVDGVEQAPYSQVLTAGSNTLTKTATDAAGNVGSAELHVVYSTEGSIPVLVAPSLPSTGIPTLTERLSFLYTGSSPVQIGAIADSLVPNRLSQLFGTARGLDSSLLSDVRVEILNHPEYGHTFTRSNGRWDMAINGGGSVVVSLSKSGYLPVQRRISLLWNQIVHVEEVFLTPISSTSLVANVSGSATIAQAVMGETVTDSSGTRQAVLNLPSGLSARIVDSAGDTTSVSSLTLRATEYTVGVTGPKAMPGTLPANSGYTYAVELSADEALSSNAKAIVFNKTASYFVENFLSFPVGTTVPTGWYDRTKGLWIPSTSGRVVKILGVSNGTVTVDINGDGLADDGDSTPSTEDRAMLASRYTAGKTLWWVPMTHLTSWDSNWGFSPPDDAVADSESQDVESPDKCPTCEEGSIIHVEDRSLGESITIPSGSWGMVWDSQRHSKILRTAQLHLSGNSIPSDVTSITLIVDIAGQHFEKEYAPQKNLTVVWVWDGNDGWGRKLIGSYDAAIQIGYNYQGVYQKTEKFGYKGNGATITACRSSEEITLWQARSVKLTNDIGDEWGFGGWTPTMLHRLDVGKMEVHLGTGGVYEGGDISKILKRVLYTAEIPGSYQGIAFVPDGGFWIGRGISLKRYSSKYVGIDSADVSHIQGLTDGWTKGVTVDLEGHPIWGSLLNIYRLNSDRSIDSFFSGNEGYCGDGGDSKLACIGGYIEGLAVDKQGNIVFADYYNCRIRKISTDGVVSTIAGNGVCGYGADSGDATTVPLYYPRSIAARKNGNILIGEYARILEIDASGKMHRIGGYAFSSGDSGDGGLATSAAIWILNSIAESPVNGDVCFTQKNSFTNAHNYGVIECIRPDGKMVMVAGNIGLDTDAVVSASRAELNQPSSLSFSPAGDMYIYRGVNYRIDRLDAASSALDNGEYHVPSKDGKEMWIFDAYGKHRATIDGITGDTLWAFEYSGITDALVRMRNGSGEIWNIRYLDGAVEIDEPSSRGKGTISLVLNDSGLVSKVEASNAKVWQMGWTSDGLLDSFVRPDNSVSKYSYDNSGRLIKDLDPRGGWKELDGGKKGDTVEVKFSTAQGVTSTMKTITLVGATKREQILPNGTVNQVISYEDGTTVSIDPYGQQEISSVSKDPRWSLISPMLAARSVTSPNGVKDTESWTASVSDTSLFNFASLTQSHVRNGQTWTTVWTRSTNQVKTTSPSGLVTTQTLDSRHRVIKQSEPGLLPVAFTYDSLDRLTSSTQGGRTTQYTWDDSGRVSGLTDPLGRRQSFRYDIAGRTLAQIFPDGRKVAFGYDAGDRVTSVTPPGRAAHGFAYDLGGLDTLSWAPKIDGNDSTPTKNRYDLDKRPTWVRLPSGDSLRASYDAAGRLISVASANDTIRYGYDTAGRLDSVFRGGQSVAYTYDGSLPLSQSWTGALTGSVSTTWNADFRPSSQTVAGTTVAFAYDADGVLSQAGDLTLSRDATTGLYSGDALGTLAHTLGRNAHGEVITDTVRNGSAILTLTSFTRDSLGRILTKVDSVNGTRSNWRYHYDLAGRLDSVWANSSLSAWYGYDSNGVRVSGTGISGVVVDAQDREISANGVSYGYDENGQLVSRSSLSGSTRYHYTMHGELLSVVTASGDSVSYTLDPSGRRIARSLNGVVTNRWLWDGSLRPVAEVDVAGNLTTRYVYGSHLNVPDYLVRAGITYRIVTDRLGSVRLVVNTSTGAVVSSLSYDVWGNVTISVNPSFQPFGYAGGLRDDATGLTHFGAREYVPELGRWSRKDPIGFNGGLSNLYGYVGNDPVNWVDASGRVTFFGGYGAGGAVGASGAVGGAGAYWNPSEGGGGYVYGGTAQGGFLSSGWSFGFTKGSICDFSGPYENVHLVLPFDIQVDFLFSPDGTLMGLDAGPATGIGVGTSSTQTYVTPAN